MVLHAGDGAVALRGPRAGGVQEGVGPDGRPVGQAGPDQPPPPRAAAAIVVVGANGPHHLPPPQLRPRQVHRRSPERLAQHPGMDLRYGILAPQALHPQHARSGPPLPHPPGDVVGPFHALELPPCGAARSGPARPDRHGRAGEAAVHEGPRPPLQPPLAGQPRVEGEGAARQPAKGGKVVVPVQGQEAPRPPRRGRGDPSCGIHHHAADPVIAGQVVRRGNSHDPGPGHDDRGGPAVVASSAVGGGCRHGGGHGGGHGGASSAGRPGKEQPGRGGGREGPGRVDAGGGEEGGKEGQQGGRERAGGGVGHGCLGGDLGSVLWDPRTAKDMGCGNWMCTVRAYY